MYILYMYMYSILLLDSDKKIVRSEVPCAFGVAVLAAAVADSCACGAGRAAANWLQSAIVLARTQALWPQQH